MYLLTRFRLRDNLGVAIRITAVVDVARERAAGGGVADDVFVDPIRASASQV